MDLQTFNSLMFLLFSETATFKPHKQIPYQRFGKKFGFDPFFLTYGIQHYSWFFIRYLPKIFTDIHDATPKKFRQKKVFHHASSDLRFGNF